MDEVARRRPDVSGLLEPRSVAVIGASDRPAISAATRCAGSSSSASRARSGRSIARRARRGLAGLGSVAELPGRRISSSSPSRPRASSEAIRDCARRGVRNGIAYAGGLADAGAEGGRAAARARRALPRGGLHPLRPELRRHHQHGDVPVTATFATALTEMDTLRPGAISMVSQSGGIATTALSIDAGRPGSASRLVSSGNEAVVSFADYLRAFAQDQGTRVIGAYLEGVADGGEARARAGGGAAARQAGRADQGRGPRRERARGAGPYRRAGRRGSRVRRRPAGDGRDPRRLGRGAGRRLLLLVGNRGKDAAGPGVGVVTFGGGNGVLAADQCAQYGLATPLLRAETASSGCARCSSRWRPPPIRSTSRRPRLSRRSPSRSCRQALDVIAAEPQIDSLVFIVGSLAAKAARDLRGHAAACTSARKAGVRQLALAAARAFRRGSPSTASTPFSRPRAACARSPARRALGRPRAAAASGRRESFRRSIGRRSSRRAAHGRVRGPLPSHPARGGAAGRGRRARSRRAARPSSAAEAVGLPVVLKGISPSVTHRAAAGLARGRPPLGGEVRAAFAASRRARARSRRRSTASTSRRCTGRHGAAGLGLPRSAVRDDGLGAAAAAA